MPFPHLLFSVFDSSSDGLYLHFKKQSLVESFKEFQKVVLEDRLKN